MIPTEPVYVEGDKRVPLSQCSYDQCHALFNRLSDKRNSAANIGMHVETLDLMLAAVEERIEMFDTGMIERPAAKKKVGFGSLRID